MAVKISDIAFIGHQQSRATLSRLPYTTIPSGESNKNEYSLSISLAA